MRDPPLLEHLHVVVSELENDDPLNLGELKICLRLLMHLTISALQILAPSPISETNGVLKTLAVTIHLREHLFVHITLRVAFK